jgi:ubiquinone/menaquinone biosynthesis C-methylase UbiE
MHDHKDMTDSHFKQMAAKFALRDKENPPIFILSEPGISEGMTILDYGCGPGGFSIAAAKLVGPKGKVYALDIQPLALEMVSKEADVENLRQIRTTVSTEGIPPQSVDVVLLYDILHEIMENTTIFKEIHRVLKKTGLLSVSDHHQTSEQIISFINETGYFKFKKLDEKTIQFNYVNT